MTADDLLAAITSRYLTSGNFNGYPLRQVALSRSELEPLVRELVEAELISLNLGSSHPNPHIKAFPAAAPAVQLEQLAATDDLTHVVAYPEHKYLAAVVDPADYEGRPFTLRLALGEGQLVPAFFELSVLENYRNDPRYLYRTNDTSGTISVSDKYFESPEMRDADQVLLQTFGYGFDESFHRAVCVFVVYLSRLSPEHQQIWAARELDASAGYKMHPAYFASSIRGEFPEKVSVFDAFLEELEQLQAMSEAAGLPPLIRESFRDAKPANFTFLIRPTLKELQDFHATLDKLMSENLNKKFLAKFVTELDTETERSDGKIVVTPKGTIKLLEEWLDQFQTDDRSDVEDTIATFREVRKLRQRPAHAADDDRFDLGLYEQQRDLMLRAYAAVRMLRLLFANHPALKDYDGVPDWLYEGKIYKY